MAVQSKKTLRNSTTTRRIRGTGSRKTAVPMARRKDIPAGKYRSRITKVSFKKTAAGDEAVEVIYELTAPDGSVRKMREVIPEDSWAFERFCDALIAAGLEDDGDIKDAVGVTEEVYLDYPNVNGLGHFTKRTPVAAKNIPVAPEDDEDNPSSGLLADEEEDDEGYLDFEID